MAAIRYYTDEHVSRAVVRGLRSRGVDVQTVAEAGRLGASDSDHPEWAQRKGRVTFSQDDDFLALAASGAMHAGIVYAPQGRRIGDLIRGLVLIHSVLDAHEMVGRIEFL